MTASSGALEKERFVTVESSHELFHLIWATDNKSLSVTLAIYVADRSLIRMRQPNLVRQAERFEAHVR